MNFNIEHYREYRRAAGKPAKDGIWDITVFPNGLYCFPLKQKLDTHGKLREHDLLGTKWERTKDGNTYIIDSVNVHWSKGYYYYVTMRQLGTKSHATGFVGNINSSDDMILEFIEDFHKSYKQVTP